MGLLITKKASPRGGINGFLHHCCKKVLVAQLVDVVQVLGFPGHVVLLAVDPLQDEKVANFLLNASEQVRILHFGIF